MRLQSLFVAGVAAAGLVLAGIAGGDAVSRRFAGGAVALTNSQANSSWATVAVLVRFDVAATGTATVRRDSQGASFVLGTCSYAGATNLVWVPDRDYSFGFGDVLVVESTATNGVVQVMRKGD
jgi:hypothetical protein